MQTIARLKERIAAHRAILPEDRHTNFDLLASIGLYLAETQGIFGRYHDEPDHDRLLWWKLTDEGYECFSVTAWHDDEGTLEFSHVIGDERTEHYYFSAEDPLALYIAN